MISRGAGIVVAAALSGLLILPASAALAHEGQSQGDLEMVAGFGTEPAYAGQPNSVQLILVHDGEPVVDLGDTLDVEVSFGDRSQRFTLEPNFAVGAFGEPGDYRAWFIPTRAGQYTFHFTGTIDGEKVDEEMSSSPKTFSSVEDVAAVSFPAVEAPSNEELATRIDEEAGRPEETVAAAEAAAASAEDAASSARTVGMVGVVLGAIGIIAAIAALVASRRKG